MKIPRDIDRSSLGKLLLVGAAWCVALLWLAALYASWNGEDPFAAAVILSGVFLVLGFVLAQAARNGVVGFRLGYLLIFAPAIHCGACGVPWPEIAVVFLVAPSAAILIAGILDLRS